MDSLTLEDAQAYVDGKFWALLFYLFISIEGFKEILLLHWPNSQFNYFLLDFRFNQARASATEVLGRCYDRVPVTKKWLFELRDHLYEISKHTPKLRSLLVRTFCPDTVEELDEETGLFWILWAGVVFLLGSFVIVVCAKWKSSRRRSERVKTRTYNPSSDWRNFPPRPPPPTPKSAVKTEEDRKPSVSVHDGAAAAAAVAAEIVSNVEIPKSTLVNDNFKPIFVSCKCTPTGQCLSCQCVKNKTFCNENCKCSLANCKNSQLLEKME